MIKQLLKLLQRFKRPVKTKHLPAQAWKQYCDENPDALECRIYEC
jgi:hypothetical protein